MKRIVLFRYHHQFERNLELLRFFKYLNPEVEVYGLYGGPESIFSEASECLKEVFSGNYLIENKTSLWKWKNSDLAYQLWYRDYGQNLDFDMLHTLEWDLLYFEPLERLFGHVPPDTLVLTGLTPVREIEKKWYWTREETRKNEREELLKHFHHEYGYKQEPFAMIGPGASFPKSFLEKIKDVEIPNLSNDENRIPMLAQVFNFPIADSGFLKKWFSNSEFKFFNADAFEVDWKTMEKQLKKPKGRRAFHPYGKELTLNQLQSLQQMIPGNRKERKPGFLKLGFLSSK